MKTMSRIWLLVFLVPVAAEPRTLEAWGRRPLAFEENRGQTDPAVRFLARAPGYALFLTPSEAVVAPGDGAAPLRLRWIGARPGPDPGGEGELPGRTHDLRGSDPAKWRTHIRSWTRVRYPEIYPGIDLLFYGDPRQLEYDFVVSPGADPRAIRLAVEGADRLEIDAAGDLVVRTGGGKILLRRPVSYQEAGGIRREVASSWRRLTGGQVGFELAAFDPTRPLVIDPVLVYSTYLGGQNHDVARAIAADSAGNAYVTGQTLSPEFPTPGASRPPQEFIFAAKLDPSGALVYSTFLGIGGGSSSGIAVDEEGHVYLAGSTPSSPGMQPDVFVAKLDPAGSSLLYQKLFGGSGPDFGTGIVVDSQGCAYLTGSTESLDFPTVNPIFGHRGRDYADAFVAKLDPSGAFLIYSTYLGGNSYDTGTAIGLDSVGHAYVAGYTDSTDFPTAHALHGDSGSTDAFVAKVHPSGSSLVYSTYLGGSDGDAGSDLATDGAGNLWITGLTHSPDFPTRNALQPSRRGSSDAFVTRLDSAGALVYSTFFGGSEFDGGFGIAVDPMGNAYLAGYTSSVGFPLVDPLISECVSGFPGEPCSIAFVTKLAPGGRRILFSTLLGGSFGENNWAIAADGRGNVYAAGETLSPDFPVANAFQPFLAGGTDAYVTRIATNRSPACSAAAARPSVIWPPNGRLAPVAIHGVTDPDGDPVTLTVTSIRQDEPLSKKGSPDAAGVGTATPRVRADRLGGGDGRVYHLGFTASDGRGGTCSGAVTVCVPRDQRPGAACADGGPLVDSIAGGS